MDSEKKKLSEFKKDFMVLIDEQNSTEGQKLDKIRK